MTCSFFFFYCNKDIFKGKFRVTHDWSDSLQVSAVSMKLKLSETPTIHPSTETNGGRIENTSHILIRLHAAANTTSGLLSLWSCILTLLLCSAVTNCWSKLDRKSTLKTITITNMELFFLFQIANKCIFLRGIIKGFTFPNIFKHTFYAFLVQTQSRFTVINSSAPHRWRISKNN